MKPSTRIRVSLRAALRRTKGYAALRVLRRGIRAAFIDHRRRSLDQAHFYEGEKELVDISRAYPRAVRKLLQRWPSLDFSDPRSEP